MTNFDSLLSEKDFTSFASVAVSAERILHIDPSACVQNCRRAMEFAVKWMYSVDKGLVMPYQDSLVSLMNTEGFRDIVGADIWRRMDLIRRMGNNAAHTGRKITEEQAVLCLENLYVFLDFVAYCYGEDYTEGHFDRSLLQQPAAPAPRGDKGAADIDLAALMAENAALKEELTARRAEQQQTYVDRLKEQSSLEQQIAEAEANLDAERQRRGMRQDDVTGDWVSGSGFWMEDSPWVAWTSDIDEYKKSLEELQSAYDENQQTLSDIEGEWRGVAQAVEDSQNQTVSYEEAVSAAVSTAQTELDNLTAAYDKAYESARTSIEGQIGLFDTMKTSSELSISDMEKAMQSQTDYLNLYSENLKKAAEYGLDDGLIKSLSDGSEESAGYINAIIQNIEKLGGSTEGMPAAASKFVTEFNSKFEETEKAKDTFADNVAKMETDFDEKMGEIETRMSKTVQNMEMTDEARKAAQDTIKAYCDAIRSMTGEAGSAAEAVANAAASHLKTAPTTTPTATTVTGHANGTLSAQEDVYIAGEKGPELIIGARGSEVFPTQETERILAAVNSAENATNAPEPELPTDVPATPFAAAALPEPTASPLPENDLPEGMEAVKEYSYLTADGQGSDAQPTGIEYVEPEVQAQTTEEAAPAEEAPVNTTAPAASDAQQEAPASSSDAPSIGETVKRVILEINGSGSIDVGGMNEESVLDILTRHAKPVLMSIIKGEIFEEGDLAYDF